MLIMPTINRNKLTITPNSHKRSNESDKYYNTKQWKNLRKYYIRNNPLCEVCLRNGNVVAAECVHHVSEFMRGATEQRRWELLLDEDNLMSVCKDCHYDIHYGTNRRKKSHSTDWK